MSVPKINQMSVKAKMLALNTLIQAFHCPRIQQINYYLQKNNNLFKFCQEQQFCRWIFTNLRTIFQNNLPKDPYLNKVEQYLLNLPNQFLDSISYNSEKISTDLLIYFMQQLLGLIQYAYPSYQKLQFSYTFLRMVNKMQNNRMIRLGVDCQKEQIIVGLKYAQSLVQSRFIVLAQKMFNQCSQAIQRVPSCNSLKSELHLIKAMILDYDSQPSAQDYYCSSISNNPHNHIAFQKIVSMYITNGNFGKAQQYINKYKWNNPKSKFLLAWQALTHLFLKTGKAYFLFKEATQLIEQHKQDISFYYLCKGELKYLEGCYEQSLSSLQKELLIHQNHSLTLKTAAIICINMQRYALALKYNYKIYLKNPSNLQNQLFLIYGLISIGQYKRAVKLVEPFNEKILQLCGCLPNLILLLPIYCKLGYIIQTIYICKKNEKYIKRLSCLNGLQMQVRIILMIKYSQIGLNEEAEKIFKQTYQPVCARPQSHQLFQQFQQIYFFIQYCINNNKQEQKEKLVIKAKSIIHKIKKQKRQVATKLQKQLQDKQYFDIQLMLANF